MILFIAIRVASDKHKIQIGLRCNLKPILSRTYSGFNRNKKKPTTNIRILLKVLWVSYVELFYNIF